MDRHASVVFEAKPSFDEFWAELIKYARTMKTRCANSRNTCQYRDGEGSACLVGHFLEESVAAALDRIDDPEWDYFSKSERAEYDELRRQIPQWMIGNKALIKIQGIHDRWHNPDVVLETLLVAEKKVLERLYYTN